MTGAPDFQGPSALHMSDGDLYEHIHEALKCVGRQMKEVRFERHSTVVRQIVDVRVMIVPDHGPAWYAQSMSQVQKKLSGRPGNATIPSSPTPTLHVESSCTSVPMRRRSLTSASSRESPSASSQESGALMIQMRWSRYRARCASEEQENCARNVRVWTDTLEDKSRTSRLCRLKARRTLSHGNH